MSAGDEKVAERVCVVCGAPLSIIAQMPVTAVPLAVLRPIAFSLLAANYSPYRSVKERLEAGQKAYKDAFVCDGDDRWPGVGHP